MDDFFEFWELFPDKRKWDRVQKEIVKYKRNLQNYTSAREILGPETFDFFQLHLVQLPYPTWEVLYSIMDIRDQEKNKPLEEVVLSSLTNILDEIEASPGHQAKLYNLLSNLYVSDWCQNQIRELIIPRIFDLKENLGLLDDVLLLALLSRSILSLLTQYMDFERKQIIGKCRMKSLFLRTCYEKVHWIETILDPMNDIDSLDHHLLQHLKLFRLIFNGDKLKYSQSQVESIDADTIQCKSSLDLCYTELQRQTTIFEFLSHHTKYSEIDEKILVKNYIINSLMSLQVEFSISTYNDISELLLRNHKLNLQQHEMTGQTLKNQIRTENDLLNEFMIVKFYLTIIQADDGDQEVIEKHLQDIRMLMKSVSDGQRQFQLLSNVFTLIFLRYEHIKKLKVKRKNSNSLQSGSISNQTSQSFGDNFDVTTESLQSGFVCLKDNLKAIINSITLFLKELESSDCYQSFDEETKRKFNVMLKNADNIMWRLKIFEQDNQKKSLVNAKEWITAMDSSSFHQITSEDEKISPKKKVHRKKFKKRPRVMKQSDENDEASENPIEYQVATENSVTENGDKQTLRSKSNESHRRIRSSMSKVLMGFESLITVCLLQGDTESIDHIIKENNDLLESAAVSEVMFIRKFHETKSQLKSIEAFDEQTERNFIDVASEIDEIKKIAECGYEKAKFLNVLESFVSNNKIKTRDSDAKLIEKATEQHKYLSYYQDDLLNLLPLIDFMISLPCPFELTLTLTEKILTDQVEDESFGYRKFIKNLLDILTIFKNNNDEKSIGDLLNEEIFTLDSVELKQQMRKRKETIRLLKFKFETGKNDSEFAEMVNTFNIFSSETNLLSKIHSYSMNVGHLLKFVTNESFGISETMLIDLDNLIFKIFGLGHHPEQVENFAYNANINLVHTLATLATGAIERFEDNPWADDDDPTLVSDVEADKSIPLENKITNVDTMYYIKQGSFMVAYLVKEIQNISYKTLTYSPNYLEALSTLHNKKMEAVLKCDNVDLKSILKKIQRTEDVNEKLKMLSSITERQWNRHRDKLCLLRDSYLEKIILNDDSQDKFLKLEEISDNKKFSELLLSCISDVDSDTEAERLLRRCLMNSEELEKLKFQEVRRWMKKLEIYRRILKLFESDETCSEVSFAKVKHLAQESPGIIANYLINLNTDLKLCRDFLSCHSLEKTELKKVFVDSLNNRSLNNQHNLLFQLIERFCDKKEFFDFALGFINNLPAITNILSITDDKSSNRYQKFLISTKIFECMEFCDDLWSLSSYPLIILEQLLMNSKIDTLNKAIKAIRPLLIDQKKCLTCGAKSLSKMYKMDGGNVFDFNAHHDELPITNECLDLLLGLYAAKALDFQIIEVHSLPAMSDASSIDSTHGLFQMPKEIPTKDKWIPDTETNHCMCCKRQKFSLLTRRHHCRRCGRIVCSSCSPYRIPLKEVYNEVGVRVCLDCHQLLNLENQQTQVAEKGNSAEEAIEWKLTAGSSDQMVRDNFEYEYSPNVFLCIAIISLHSPNDELAKFLLFHCHRLRILLHPIRGKNNPEVDLILVSKMLKCLAMAAKIRGADGEATSIIDHANFFLKIIDNGCEALTPQIPIEPINSVSIRSIINDLIKSENWEMALELSVKWDRSGTAGVFSAWGVSAIRSGQYQFARNKISLALPIVPGSSPQANENFVKMLNGNSAVDEKSYPLRHFRSLPLLNEVLESIETTASKVAVQTPSRSKQSKKESLKNVLNIMENLKNTCDGNYGKPIKNTSDKFEWHSTLIKNTTYYDESMFYLLNYGGHVEFLLFLMKNNLVHSALRYTISQRVPHELFIQHVFAPIVKTGRLEELLSLLRKMDENLLIWKDYLIAACKHLEHRRAFNCLYHLQILTGDLIRAAMTCIKFYLNESTSYSDLHSKSHHLVMAKHHLQNELEKSTEWSKVGKHEKQGKGELSLILKWDPKTINEKINIIGLQLEAAKYLAKCENDGLPTIGLLTKISLERPKLNTLFGKNQEKVQVSILVLICGSIDSGFGISYKLIQHCNLNSSKIYNTCTKFLAGDLQRLMEVGKLITSIKMNSNEHNKVDPDVINNCDELIAMAVEIAYNRHQCEAKSHIDQLIKMISSKKIKVQCYIKSNQLKTAYMISASLNNLEEIRKIMKQAEMTKQENVRRLCERKLQQRPTITEEPGQSDI